MSIYRMDNRTEKEFKKDIKRSHKTELDIAVRMALLDFQTTGKWPEIKPNGSDMSGKFISDENKVTGAPDYLIGDRLVEITRADTFCRKVFHEKVAKVNKCIKVNSSLVFVNGFEAFEEPQFIELTPEQIKQFTHQASVAHGTTGHPTKTGFISKDSYRYEISWFDGIWKTLPALNKEALKQYKTVISQIWGS